MNDAGSGGAGAKRWKFKRVALWGGGGLLGLAVIGAALDPEVGNQNAPGEAQPTAASHADLRAAMKLVAGEAIFALAIPSGTRPADLEAAAKGQCADRSFCQVYGWQDAANVPAALPMLDREVSALSFRYALNRSTGYEYLTWYCGSVGAKPDCTKAVAD
jgi:hypothetical protein